MIYPGECRRGCCDMCTGELHPWVCSLCWRYWYIHLHWDWDYLVCAVLLSNLHPIFLFYDLARVVSFFRWKLLLTRWAAAERVLMVFTNFPIGMEVTSVVDPLLDMAYRKSILFLRTCYTSHPMCAFSVYHIGSLQVFAHIVHYNRVCAHCLGIFFDMVSIARQQNPYHRPSPSLRTNISSHFSHSKGASYTCYHPMVPIVDFRAPCWMKTCHGPRVFSTSAYRDLSWQLQLLRKATKWSIPYRGALGRRIWLWTGLGGWALKVCALQLPGSHGYIQSTPRAYSWF